MATNKLFSVYGAKKSKNSNRINITLIRSEGENKEWACISLDPANKKSKTACKLDKDGKFLILKIPMLVPKDKEEVTDDVLDMPF